MYSHWRICNSNTLTDILKIWDVLGYSFILSVCHICLAKRLDPVF